MTITVAGKVTSKTVNAEGHSQVRMQVECTMGAGKANAEIIVSTPSVELVEAFKVGQSVSFTL
jgi:hypothetical protein